MNNLVPTTRRCLGMPISSKPLGLVARMFIKQDGGKANIAAKTLATLWYLLVLPDAQTRFNRELHRKRMPWYAPSRIFGMALAATNIITMPLSWAFLFAGKRNASRLAAAGVLINPPTITLALLLVSELSASVIKKSCRLVKVSGRVISKPFIRKQSSSQSATNSSNPTTSNNVTVNVSPTSTTTNSESPSKESNTTPPSSS